MAKNKNNAKPKKGSKKKPTEKTQSQRYAGKGSTKKQKGKPGGKNKSAGVRENPS